MFFGSFSLPRHLTLHHHFNGLTSGFQYETEFVCNDLISRHAGFFVLNK